MRYEYKLNIIDRDTECWLDDAFVCLIKYPFGEFRSMRGLVTLPFYELHTKITVTTSSSASRTILLRIITSLVLL